ncbi:unnamed protein product [Fusarium graminearum]|nr:unnamed protein product [Fusarium graminearum]
MSSSCLHATPNLAKTLSNLRKLLHPQGRLFLIELSPESSKSVNYIMGPPSGWWLSEDGQENEPYAPFLANITEEQFNAFKSTLFSVQDAPFCWVTGACQIGCKNPDYALVNGMARSIRQETGIDLVTFELEVFDESAWRALSDLVKTFPSRVTDGEVDTDFESEYAFHGDTRAVGLNFKDVLIAMGIVEATNNSLAASDFGFEGAGIVTRVGSGVQRLVVGDRVAFSSTGCFSTSQTMPKMYCTNIHKSLTFQEAAIIPCVFSTAMYGLVDLARLEAEQSVLIHSACGGVRQAAIQIAKMIRAEVCTPSTSSSEDKMEYLTSVFGIPRDHIFKSRDSSFRQGILKATDGRGVDVVLNSLSGELLHESWNCVTKFGTIVEIRKRDFIGKAELAMDRFENNRTFIGLDHTEL